MKEDALEKMFDKMDTEQVLCVLDKLHSRGEVYDLSWVDPSWKFNVMQDTPKRFAFVVSFNCERCKRNWNIGNLTKDVILEYFVKYNQPLVCDECHKEINDFRVKMYSAKASKEGYIGKFIHKDTGIIVGAKFTGFANECVQTYPLPEHPPNKPFGNVYGIMLEMHFEEDHEPFDD